MPCGNTIDLGTMNYTPSTIWLSSSGSHLNNNIEMKIWKKLIYNDTKRRANKNWCRLTFIARGIYYEIKLNYVVYWWVKVFAWIRFDELSPGLTLSITSSQVKTNWILFSPVLSKSGIYQRSPQISQRITYICLYTIEQHFGNSFRRDRVKSCVFH